MVWMSRRMDFQQSEVFGVALIAACESACNDDSSSGSESVPPKPFIVVLRLNFIVAALVGTSFISDALPISLTGDD